MMETSRVRWDDFFQEAVVEWLNTTFCVPREAATPGPTSLKLSYASEARVYLNTALFTTWFCNATAPQPCSIHSEKHMDTSNLHYNAPLSVVFWK